MFTIKNAKKLFVFFNHTPPPPGTLRPRSIIYYCLFTKNRPSTYLPVFENTPGRFF